MKKNYIPPRMQVIRLQQKTSILVGSSGSGYIPPTDNDDDDNDWP